MNRWGFIAFAGVLIAVYCVGWFTGRWAERSLETLTIPINKEICVKGIALYSEGNPFSFTIMGNQEICGINLHYGQVTGPVQYGFTPQQP